MGPPSRLPISNTSPSQFRLLPRGLSDACVFAVMLVIVLLLNAHMQTCQEEKPASYRVLRVGGVASTAAVPRPLCPTNPLVDRMLLGGAVACEQREQWDRPHT